MADTGNVECPSSESRNHNELSATSTKTKFFRALAAQECWSGRRRRSTIAVLCWSVVAVFSAQWNIGNFQVSLNSQDFSKHQLPLELVHITKTGGSALEHAASKAGVVWGFCHSYVYNPDVEGHCPGAHELRSQLSIKINVTLAPPNYGKKAPHEHWHVPYHWLIPPPFPPNVSTFTVVRNPYTRIVSEYYCPFFGNKKGNIHDPSVLNAWVGTWLQKLTAGKVGGRTHMLPSHHYVYDKFGNKVINHVLRYESIQTDFSTLMKTYNMTHIVLPPKREGASLLTKQQMLSARNLTAESLRMINSCYREDFGRFGYKMVDDPADFGF